MSNLKKAIRTSIIILFILSIISVVSSATQTGAANQEAKLRKEATNDSICLEIIPKKDEFEIIEKSGDWYKVNYKKIKGYVESKYITINEDNSQNTIQQTNEIVENTINEENNIEQNEISNTTSDTNNNVSEKQETTNVELKIGDTITIKEDNNVHLRPVINSMSIGKILKDAKAQVIENINGWIYINSDTTSGWIRKEKILLQEEVTDQKEQTANTETEKEETKTQLNKTAYIVSTGINFRKEANTDSEILKVFVQNTKITLLEESGDWYKIKYNDQEGYVIKTYVSEKKVEATVRSAEQRTPATTEENEQKETVSSNATSNSNAAQKVVDLAKKYVGYKYVYGGSTPSKGFDCSGFTMYVYKQFGVSLSHSATAQSKVGTKIQKSNLQVGDLVFFSDYKTYKGIGHCGIYIGNNKFIHASTEKTGVIISSLTSGSYVKRYVTATRLI